MRLMALAQPDFKRRQQTSPAEPAGGTPEQFSDLIKSEATKWAKVVKDSGAKLD